MTNLESLKPPNWNAAKPCCSTLFSDTEAKIRSVISEASQLLSKDPSEVWTLFVYSRRKKKLEWECPLCTQSLTLGKTKSLLSLKLRVLRHLGVHHVNILECLETHLDAEWSLLNTEYGADFAVLHTVPKSVKKLDQHRSSINFITHLDDSGIVALLGAKTMCEICCEGVTTLDHMHKHSQLESKPSFSEFFPCEESSIDDYPFPHPLFAYTTNCGEQQSTSTSVPSDPSEYTWKCRMTSCTCTQKDSCSFPSIVLMKMYALKHFESYHEGLFNEDLLDNEWSIVQAESGVKRKELDLRKHRQHVEDTAYPDDFLLPVSNCLIPFASRGNRTCGFCYFTSSDEKKLKRHLMSHQYEDEREPFLPPKSLEEGVSAVRELDVDFVRRLTPTGHLHGDKELYNEQMRLWEEEKRGGADAGAAAVDEEVAVSVKKKVAKVVKRRVKIVKPKKRAHIDDWLSMIDGNSRDQDDESEYETVEEIVEEEETEMMQTKERELDGVDADSQRSGTKESGVEKMTRPESAELPDDIPVVDHTLIVDPSAVSQIILVDEEEEEREKRKKRKEMKKKRREEQREKQEVLALAESTSQEPAVVVEDVIPETKRKEKKEKKKEKQVLEKEDNVISQEKEDLAPVQSTSQEPAVVVEEVQVERKKKKKKEKREKEIPEEEDVIQAKGKTADGHSISQEPVVVVEEVPSERKKKKKKKEKEKKESEVVFEEDVNLEKNTVEDVPLDNQIVHSDHEMNQQRETVDERGKKKKKRREEEEEITLASVQSTSNEPVVVEARSERKKNKKKELMKKEVFEDEINQEKYTVDDHNVEEQPVTHSANANQLEKAVGDKKRKKTDPTVQLPEESKKTQKIPDAVTSSDDIENRVIEQEDEPMDTADTVLKDTVPDSADTVPASVKELELEIGEPVEDMDVSDVEDAPAEDSMSTEELAQSIEMVTVEDEQLPANGVRSDSESSSEDEDQPMAKKKTTNNTKVTVEEAAVAHVPADSTALQPTEVEDSTKTTVTVEATVPVRKQVKSTVSADNTVSQPIQDVTEVNVTAGATVSQPIQIVPKDTVPAKPTVPETKVTVESTTLNDSTSSLDVPVHNVQITRNLDDIQLSEEQLKALNTLADLDLDSLRDKNKVPQKDECYQLFKESGILPRQQKCPECEGNMVPPAGVDGSSKWTCPADRTQVLPRHGSVVEIFWDSFSWYPCDLKLVLAAMVGCPDNDFMKYVGRAVTEEQIQALYQFWPLNVVPFEANLSREHRFVVWKSMVHVPSGNDIVDDVTVDKNVTVAHKVNVTSRRVTRAARSKSPVVTRNLFAERQFVTPTKVVVKASVADQAVAQKDPVVVSQAQDTVSPNQEDNAVVPSEDTSTVPDSDADLFDGSEDDDDDVFDAAVPVKSALSEGKKKKGGKRRVSWAASPLHQDREIPIQTTPFEKEETVERATPISASGKKLDEPEQCSICLNGYVYKTSRGMDNHVEKMHCHRVYSCGECGEEIEEGRNREIAFGMHLVAAGHKKSTTMKHELPPYYPAMQKRCFPHTFGWPTESEQSADQEEEEEMETEPLPEPVPSRRSTRPISITPMQFVKEEQPRLQATERGRPRVVDTSRHLRAGSVGRLPARTVTCQECEQRLPDEESSIVEHVKEHMKEKYECQLCESHFAEVDLVHDHLKEAHTVTLAVDQFFNVVEGRSLPVTRRSCFPSFGQRSASMEPVEKLACQECKEKVSQEKWSIAEHVKKHSEKHCVCQLCGSMLPDVLTAFVHVRQVHAVTTTTVRDRLITCVESRDPEVVRKLCFPTLEQDFPIVRPRLFSSGDETDTATAEDLDLTDLLFTPLFPPVNTSNATTTVADPNPAPIDNDTPSRPNRQHRPPQPHFEEEITPTTALTISEMVIAKSSAPEVESSSTQSNVDQAKSPAEKITSSIAQPPAEMVVVKSSVPEVESSSSQNDVDQSESPEEEIVPFTVPRLAEMVIVKSSEPEVESSQNIHDDVDDHSEFPSFDQEAFEQIMEDLDSSNIDLMTASPSDSAFANQAEVAEADLSIADLLGMDVGETPVRRKTFGGGCARVTPVREFERRSLSPPEGPARKKPMLYISSTPIPPSHVESIEVDDVEIVETPIQSPAVFMVPSVSAPSTPRTSSVSAHTPRSRIRARSVSTDSAISEQYAETIDELMTHVKQVKDAVHRNARKAIQYLVQRMCNRDVELDALGIALKSNGKTPTRCVTIPSVKRMQIVKGVLEMPHAVAARLWRWPDVTLKQLRKLSYCPTSEEEGVVCVNPYHYEKTVEIPMLLSSQKATSPSLLLDSSSPALQEGVTSHLASVSTPASASVPLVSTPTTSRSASASRSRSGGRSLGTVREQFGARIEVLESYRKESVNPEFVRKAVQFLLNKWEKEDREENLDALVAAVMANGESPSRCVTIPHNSCGIMLIAGSKTKFPHVLYARIWRWTNITKDDVMRLPCCLNSPGIARKICINPFHLRLKASVSLSGTASDATAQEAVVEDREEFREDDESGEIEESAENNQTLEQILGNQEGAEVNKTMDRAESVEYDESAEINIEYVNQEIIEEEESAEINGDTGNPENVDDEESRDVNEDLDNEENNGETCSSTPSVPVMPSDLQSAPSSVIRPRSRCRTWSVESNTAVIEQFSETIDELQSHAKGSVDPQLVRQSAIYLVKKLENKEDELKTLVDVLKSEGKSPSSCVTIPRNPSGGTHIGKKTFSHPHVLFCSIWRWSDVPRERIVQLQCCATGPDDLQNFCVNPYHYELALSVSVVDMLQSYRKEGADAKLTRSAIAYLENKWKDESTKFDTMVDVLKAGGNVPTQCVTIPHTSGGRISIGGTKHSSYALFARIWRWPGARTESLRRLRCCVPSPDESCINPYHLEIIDASSSESHKKSSMTRKRKRISEVPSASAESSEEQIPKKRRIVSMWSASSSDGEKTDKNNEGEIGNINDCEEKSGEVREGEEGDITGQVESAEHIEMDEVREIIEEEEGREIVDEGENAEIDEEEESGESTGQEEHAENSEKGRREIEEEVESGEIMEEEENNEEEESGESTDQQEDAEINEEEGRGEIEDEVEIGEIVEDEEIEEGEEGGDIEEEENGEIVENGKDAEINEDKESGDIGEQKKGEEDDDYRMIDESDQDSDGLEDIFPKTNVTSQSLSVVSSMPVAAVSGQKSSLQSVSAPARRLSISRGASIDSNTSICEELKETVEELMAYEKATEAGEDPVYVRKAVHYLAKKFRNEEDKLDILLTALKSGGKTPTDCVTIRPNQDGRICVAMKFGLPRVIFSRIWRWPDVIHEQMKRLPCCTTPSKMRCELACINPYHYTRIEASPSMRSRVFTSMKSVEVESQEVNGVGMKEGHEENEREGEVRDGKKSGESMGDEESAQEIEQEPEEEEREEEMVLFADVKEDLENAPEKIVLPESSTVYGDISLPEATEDGESVVVVESAQTDERNDVSPVVRRGSWSPDDRLTIAETGETETVDSENFDLQETAVDYDDDDIFRPVPVQPSSSVNVVEEEERTVTEPVKEAVTSIPSPSPQKNVQKTARGSSYKRKDVEDRLPSAGTATDRTLATCQRILEGFVWDGPQPPAFEERQVNILVTFKEQKKCSVCEMSLNLRPDAIDAECEWAMLAHLIVHHPNDMDVQILLSRKSLQLSNKRTTKEVNRLCVPPFRLNPTGILECSACLSNPPRRFENLEMLSVHWEECARNGGERRQRVSTTFSSSNVVSCPLPHCKDRWINRYACTNTVTVVCHLLSEHSTVEKAYDKAIELGETERMSYTVPYLNVAKSFQLSAAGPRRSLCCSICEETFGGARQFLEHSKKAHSGGKLKGGRIGGRRVRVKTQKRLTGRDEEEESKSAEKRRRMVEDTSGSDISPSSSASRPAKDPKRQSVYAWLNQCESGRVVPAVRSELVEVPEARDVVRGLPTGSSEVDLKQVMAGSVVVRNKVIPRTPKVLFDQTHRAQLAQLWNSEDRQPIDISHIPDVQGTPCPQCSFLGQTPTDTRLHYRREHGEKREGREREKKRDHMNGGEQRRSEKKENTEEEHEVVACAACYKPFKTLANLQFHVLMGHKKDEKCFACRVCSRLFSNRTQLEAHSRTHSGQIKKK